MTVPFIRWMNIVAFIAVIIVNWAAMALPLFGRDTGEISDLYPTAITPAGYAFSIWGIIYSLLIGFIVLQALPRNAKQLEISRIGPWFIISSILNITWLVLWHALQITASVFVMIALFISLLIIYLRTRSSERQGTWAMRVFVSGTWSIYLGWISVAMIVNISVALFNLGWDGFGLRPDVWAMILLGIAGLLSWLMGRKFNDPFYGLVIAWASIAVSVQHNEAYPTLALVGYVIAILIIIHAVYISIQSIFRRSRSNQV